MAPASLDEELRISLLAMERKPYTAAPMSRPTMATTTMTSMSEKPRRARLVGRRSFTRDHCSQERMSSAVPSCLSSPLDQTSPESPPCVDGQTYMSGWPQSSFGSLLRYFCETSSESVFGQESVLSVA